MHPAILTPPNPVVACATRLRRSERTRSDEDIQHLSGRPSHSTGTAVGEVDWQKHLLEESDGNTRWLARQQVDRILAVAPEHMKGPLIAATRVGRSRPIYATLG